MRTRTLASGAGLGGVLLLGLALLGGVGDAPTPFEERAPERRGPVTAIQPQLREALLTNEDLPPAPEPTTAAAAEPSAPTVTVPDLPDRAGAPETGAVADLCRILLGEAREPTGKLSGEAREPNRKHSGEARVPTGKLSGGSAGLTDLWPIPPQESTFRRTEQRGGGTLHQVLGVFGGDRSVEAYRTLRESAAGCDRFEAALADGTQVTMILRELTGDRRESGHADDAYTWLILLEDGTPAGWLSVDRIGPVVSVLRHLGPTADDADIGHTRRAALAKLEPLLRTIHPAG